MRTVNVNSFPTGRYWLGNREYGYHVCSVDFSLDACEELTEEQRFGLCEQFAKILAEELERESSDVGS